MSTDSTINKPEDYHGHPPYVKIWAALVALFISSLFASALGNHHLAVGLIFGVAIIKAALVLGNFMHVRWEPRLILWVILFSIMVLGIFFFGVYPDIVPIAREVAY